MLMILCSNKVKQSILGFGCVLLFPTTDFRGSCRCGYGNIAAYWQKTEQHLTFAGDSYDNFLLTAALNFAERKRLRLPCCSFPGAFKVMAMGLKLEWVICCLSPYIFFSFWRVNHHGENGVIKQNYSTAVWIKQARCPVFNLSIHTNKNIPCWR